MQLDSPVVDGSRAFVLGRAPDGNYGDQVWALNASSGAVLWGPVTIPERFYWSPGLVAEASTVYMTTTTGEIYALSAATGAIEHTFQIPDVQDVNARYVLGNGMLFVPVIEPQAEIVGVDLDNWTVKWSSDVYINFGGAPLFAAGTVYVPFGCEVTAFDGSTGTLKWSSRASCAGWNNPVDGQIPVAQSTYVSPVLSAGVIYAPGGGAYDAANGAPERGFRSVNSLAVDRDLVFVTQPTDQDLAILGDNLAAINRNTGKVIWTQAGDGGIFSPVALADGYIIVGSPNDTLAVDESTGRIVWSGDVDDDVGEGQNDPPAVDGSRVLLPTLGGAVICLTPDAPAPLPSAQPTAPPAVPTAAAPDAASQYRIDTAEDNASPTAVSANRPDRLWSDALGGTLSYPLSVGGRVFVANGRTLFALDRRTGAVLWKDNPILGVGSVLSGLSADHSNVYVFDGAILYAFRQNTGTEVWSAAEPTPLGGAIVADDGRLFMDCTSLSEPDDYAICSFDPANGQPSHISQPLLNPGEGSISAPLVAGANLLLSGTAGNVAANAETGHLIWAASAPFATSGHGGVVHGDSLYTGGPTATDVKILATSTGRTAGNYRSYWEPAVDNSTRVKTIGSASGVQLEGVSNTTSKELWTTPTVDRLVLPPLEAGNQVIDATSTAVFAFSLETGKQLWTVRVPGRVEPGVLLSSGVSGPSPVSAFGTLLISTVAGRLLAYSAPPPRS